MLLNGSVIVFLMAGDIWKELSVAFEKEYAHCALFKIVSVIDLKSHFRLMTIDYPKSRKLSICSSSCAAFVRDFQLVLWMVFFSCAFFSHASKGISKEIWVMFHSSQGNLMSPRVWGLDKNLSSIISCRGVRNAMFGFRSHHIAIQKRQENGFSRKAEENLEKRSKWEAFLPLISIDCLLFNALAFYTF